LSVEPWVYPCANNREEEMKKKKGKEEAKLPPFHLRTPLLGQ
jgi:hypothetical protein